MVAGLSPKPPALTTLPRGLVAGQEPRVSWFTDLASAVQRLDHGVQTVMS